MSYSFGNQKANADYFGAAPMARLTAKSADMGMQSHAGAASYKAGAFMPGDVYMHLKAASYSGRTRKKPRSGFIPTTCKRCGTLVSYDTISKDRLRANGSRWIDTCDECVIAGANKS